MKWSLTVVLLPPIACLLAACGSAPSPSSTAVGPVTTRAPASSAFQSLSDHLQQQYAPYFQDVQRLLTQPEDLSPTDFRQIKMDYGLEQMAYRDAVAGLDGIAFDPVATADVAQLKQSLVSLVSAFDPVVLARSLDDFFAAVGSSGGLTKAVSAYYTKDLVVRADLRLPPLPRGQIL